VGRPGGASGNSAARPAAETSAENAADAEACTPENQEVTERQRIINALEQAGWVQAKAARLLNLTPRQIAYRIQTLDIEMKQI
jgi:Nif-specific regulatory protein